MSEKQNTKYIYKTICYNYIFFGTILVCSIIERFPGRKKFFMNASKEVPLKKILKRNSALILFLSLIIGLAITSLPNLPESGSLVILGSGLIGLAMIGRKKLT